MHCDSALYKLTLTYVFYCSFLFSHGPKLETHSTIKEQTLGSGTEVAQPPVQKYGTVCRLHSDSLA